MNSLTLEQALARNIFAALSGTDDVHVIELAFQNDRIRKHAEELAGYLVSGLDGPYSLGEDEYADGEEFQEGYLQALSEMLMFIDRLGILSVNEQHTFAFNLARDSMRHLIQGRIDAVDEHGVLDEEPTHEDSPDIQSALSAFLAKILQAKGLDGVQAQG